jgi:hypothetical protein
VIVISHQASPARWLAHLTRAAEFTNGTPIDAEIIDLWNELPPVMVEISICGLTREVYEQVVAVRGSYDRCLAGIDRVTAAEHPLSLKCPATTENVHEIPALLSSVLPHADSAAAAVLANSFLPVHDPVGAERTLRLAARLAAHIPVAELRSPLDGAVVPFAWEEPAAYAWA